MANMLTLIAFVFLSSSPISDNKVESEYNSLGREITELLLENKKEEFLKAYAPTQEGLLEFSYKENYEKIPVKEKNGFYESVAPTIELLKEELDSSFDFVNGKLKSKGIQKVDKIEIYLVKNTLIGETPTKNVYFTVLDQNKKFKIEILGLYKTNNGWMIMSDIAPGYF